MVTPRVAWSALWLSAVLAFAIGYLRTERDRKIAEDARLRARLTNWQGWDVWRKRVVSSEFEVASDG